MLTFKLHLDPILRLDRIMGHPEESIRDEAVHVKIVSNRGLCRVCRKRKTFYRFTRRYYPWSGRNSGWIPMKSFVCRKCWTPTHTQAIILYLGQMNTLPSENWNTSAFSIWWSNADRSPKAVCEFGTKGRSKALDSWRHCRRTFALTGIHKKSYLKRIERSDEEKKCYRLTSSRP